jgi:hypothetical protein
MANEVKVTGGIGAFFWGLVPGALGGGALIWLAFVGGCIDLQQQRTIAQRMDNRVGVVEPLKNPVVLIIHQPDCYKIERAFIDDNTVVAYTRNTCSHKPGYAETHWQAFAPDGTIIQQHYENSLDNVSPGQAFEWKTEIPQDDRIAKIIVWSTLSNTASGS